MQSPGKNIAILCNALAGSGSAVLCAENICTRLSDKIFDIPNSKIPGLMISAFILIFLSLVEMVHLIILLTDTRV